MTDKDIFSKHGFELLEDFRFSQCLLSRIYYNRNSVSVLIIDYPDIFRSDFPYKRYCQKQNELMNDYRRVYRFLENDGQIDSFLKGSFYAGTEYLTGRTYDRESRIPDSTPLEFLFEECMEEAFGPIIYKYLKKEYSFITEEGRTAYIDYAMFKKDGTWIAFEENGISYHHPAVIGRKRYSEILKKQNSVVMNDGIVFRWDTDSLSNRSKVADELREFIGEADDYIIQSSMKSMRGVKLYEHQADYLTDLQSDRSHGSKSALVLLPTGTGKTTVALEDLRNFSDMSGRVRSLVMVPTKELAAQWERESELYQIKDLQIETYAAAARNYYDESPYKYSYIIVDEAHHAMAPVLRKAISHYQPDFLLGLTATDKRLDAKKLETVFNEYEEKIDLKQAIEKGLLSQIRSFRLKSSIDLSQVRFNGKDYNVSDLEKRIRVNSRNELIADVLYKYFYEKLSGKQGVIFCINIEHAKEMAELLKKKGFKAEYVYGADKKRDEKITAYMNRQIQFLCTCSLLTEGWDAPHTSVIVMARPTMSKVLYTQQLGRGTRNCAGKEALYVIDVVDTYGNFGSISNRPWSLHSLFRMDTYRAWADLFDQPSGSYSELLVLGTTYEKEIKLQPFDVFTFQDSYGDYLSAEQIARELFVSTDTVNNWIKKGDVKADLIIPMGRKNLVFFHPDRTDDIRQLKGLKKHTEDTIVEDFWEFIEQRDYTFSYKMYFILAFLDVADSTGDADIKELMLKYRDFYLQRFDKGLIIDRKNSPYSKKDHIQDDKVLMRSILENPFEKFERKRFMYYSEDLSRISIHHKIWDDLTKNNGMERLRSQMLQDIEDYYKKLH